MPKVSSKPKTKLEEENESLKQQLLHLQAEAGKLSRYPNESWIQAINRRAKAAKNTRDRLKVCYNSTDTFISFPLIQFFSPFLFLKNHS